jgi:23S rRNA (adenine1618-N6)-methyltransferase
MSAGLFFFSGIVYASKQLHPRNAFKGSYDIGALVRASPPLKAHVIPAALSKSRRDTIDFADPSAVRALNQALLAEDYNVGGWELPAGMLCPPIPGRADYVHHLADVLAEATAAGAPPQGANVRVLDIGTGSSAIYPLIGASVYKWSFVGTESNKESYESARRILAANVGAHASLQSSEVRLQSDPFRLLAGVCDEARDEFDLCMCNPPFYTSAQEFARENQRKVVGLAENRWRRNGVETPPRLPARGERASSDNFGGGEAELWCKGGEVAFVSALISESEEWADRCLWFSSLVSRAEHLPPLLAKLRRARGVVDARVIDMGPGQKKTSVLLWTFTQATARRGWARRRQWGE